MRPQLLQKDCLSLQATLTARSPMGAVMAPRTCYRQDGYNGSWKAGTLTWDAGVVNKLPRCPV